MIEYNDKVLKEIENGFCFIEVSPEKENDFSTLWVEKVNAFKEIEKKIFNTM